MMLVSRNSDTTGNTNCAESTLPSGTTELNPGVLFAQSLVVCISFLGNLFILFLLAIVISFLLRSMAFWLPKLDLLFTHLFQSLI